MKKIFIVIIGVSLCYTSYSQVWDDNFIGIDSLWNTSGGIECIYSFSNYNDSILYIGGAFEMINNDSCICITSWDKTNTYLFQKGVELGWIWSTIVYKDTLYIGGTFKNASENPNTKSFAKWNGNNWEGPSIGGFTSSVENFCIFNNMLIVSGRFENIGSETFDKIVAYDGENWINMGSMGMWVSGLAVFNGELYAGGYFGLRKYLGGTNWEDFDIEPNNNIYGLKTDTINSFLYVGGQFTAVDGQPSVGTAMWDGFKWHPLGDYNKTAAWRNALEIYRGDLYTGTGVYYTENDDYRTYITRWNGETWDSIGGAFSDNIFALEVFCDTLYIGGGFFTWSPVYPEVRQSNKGIVKLYMPEVPCNYLKPRINTYADTFYIENGAVNVNLYNNNPYADSWDWDFADSQFGTERNPVHTYTQTGEYNVQLTVTQDGCVKTANKTIYIELGSETPNFKDVDMQIFPNPSSNNFTIKTNMQKYENVEIKIAGLNGHLKSVIPVTGDTTLIPTKGWKTGVYICNLFVNNRLVKTEKLIYE